MDFVSQHISMGLLFGSETVILDMDILGWQTDFFFVKQSIDSLPLCVIFLLLWEERTAEISFSPFILCKENIKISFPS